MGAAVAAFVVSVGSPFLLAAPASASTCHTRGCGGEVSNNSSTYSIRIANCWKDSYGWEEEGDKLSCVRFPGARDSDNADFELPRGAESKDYSHYYDTDAIRFYRGCVTTYHTWGLPKQTIDRRGKPSLWRKINNATHAYIDKIVC